MTRLLLLSALLLGLVATAACSGSSDSAPPTATPAPEPAAIVDEAADAIAAIDSFHFRLEHENGTSPMPLDLQLVAAEGDIIVPDQLKAEVKAKAGSLNIDVDVIAIGNQTWITNPFSRKWQILPNATIRDIADPVALVEAVTGGLGDVRERGDEKVDGVETLVFTGTLDSGALRQALPFAEAGHTVDVTVWIGADDKLPRKARLAGPLNDDEPDDIVRLIELSHFNDSSIEITAP